MGRMLTFNTPFWVRPSIGFLQLHGHYPREVADLHAYTSGGGQSIVSRRKINKVLYPLIHFLLTNNTLTTATGISVEISHFEWIVPMKP